MKDLRENNLLLKEDYQIFKNSLKLKKVEQKKKKKFIIY